MPCTRHAAGKWDFEKDASVSAEIEREQKCPPLQFGHTAPTLSHTLQPKSQRQNDGGADGPLIGEINAYFIGEQKTTVRVDCCGRSLHLFQLKGRWSKEEASGLWIWIGCKEAPPPH